MSDDKPLEILPWGRSLEDAERLARKKQAGKRGAFGCLLYPFAFALVAMFAWGWSVGRTSQDSVNESAVTVARTATESRK